jgi:hypothetical protein
MQQSLKSLIIHDFIDLKLITGLEPMERDIEEVLELKVAIESLIC